MLDGDISNEVAPRILWVWEGLVAVAPSVHPVRFIEMISRKAGRRRSRIMSMEANPNVAHVMWDLNWRWDLRNDLVTLIDWAPSKVVRGWVQEWADEHDLPVSHVHAMTRTQLARQLPFMPNVLRVLDPDPDRATTWGPVGRLWADPERIQDPLA